MKSIGVVFICLINACHARRARTAAKSLQSSVIEDSMRLKAFSTLLHTLNPEAAFRPSGSSTFASALDSKGLRSFATKPRVLHQPRLFFQKPEEISTPPKPDTFIADGVRSQGRVLGIFALWASLIAYVILGAPGKDALAQAADNELLTKLIANPFDATVAPFFACVFNFMGLWPAWYACVLLPGAAQQKPVPAAPFLLGSVALGMFALSPYLAVREYREDGVAQTDLNWLSKWTEGKINAIFLSVGAASLFYYGLTANDGNLALSASQYSDLFSKQLFVHVTSLDFLSLWALSYGALAEDAKRRGLDCPSPLFAAVPIVGHCAWLLLRPPLPEK